MKEELEKYKVKAFVAHEDIHPTEQWANDISNALSCMDVFVSIHTKGFQESLWCQQEVGYAFASNKKIIPIKFEENPVGFISSIQALPRRKRTAGEIVNEILKVLTGDTETHDIYKKMKKIEEMSPEDLPF